MNIKYLILALTILSLALSGCGEDTSDNVVDELPGEEDSAADTETENLEELSTKEAIEQAYKEAGLLDDSEDEETEDESEQEAEEETTAAATPAGNSEHNIIIQNFRGTPDDLDISVGDTITWTNLMTNYKQIIIIMPWVTSEGKYDDKWINDVKEILTNETYSYTFNESCKYQWGSKTKFDKINGEITVA